MLNIMYLDSYDVIILYLGIIILIASILPRLLSKHIITAPIAYLVLGVIVFSFFQTSPLPHLGEYPYIGKRLTELGVIISLTAVGLKLKKPFAWATWRYAFRLLVITMPLTIALIFLFGWSFLGFAPATAMLLGAVLAPTDPVLASDVQTTPPGEEDSSNVRLALTTEAGLNDGFAFPFTNMAIAMALISIHPGDWFSDWLLTDFFYKIIVGTVVGLVTGWLLAKIIYLCPKTKNRSSFISTGLLALSLTFFPYGLAEVLSSYGFIAVFIAACTFRYQESINEHLALLHDFSEEMERVLVAILFTVLSIYLCHGFLDAFEWYMLPSALVIVFVIRPLSGLIGFIGTKLPKEKKLIISFFGIRGIGSIYYLLYAFYKAEFEQANELLSLVTVVILMSVFIHGISAEPIMKRWVER